MIRRISMVCLAVAVALTGATAAYAQGVQTGTLIGTVATSDGDALPGVTVTASSPAMMGSRSTVSAGNGDYVIRGLTPGQYTVQFVLQGMQTVTSTANIGLGQPTRVDAQLVMLVTEETIEVTGEAPSALETTTVGANFTADEIEELPITNRTPVGIGQLSGAVTSRTPVGGQLSINGGMAYDNNVLINGVNVQDPIFGTVNNLFIEDAIAETQVLTSGISAEYGHFTGGVLNVITKSGGNDFSGSFRASLSDPEWRDETPFEEDRGIEREGDLGKIFSATLGGPIVRDRVWFFLAGRDEENSTQPALQVTGINVPRTISNERYEVKLTGNITPRHTLQGAYTDSPVEATHEIQVTPLELDAIGLNSVRVNEGFNVGYTGVLSNNMFAEARYSEKTFGFRGLGGTSDNIFDSPFRSSGVRFPGNTTGTYNAPYFDATDPEDRNNDQLYGALSYFLTSDNLGSHDIKLGVESFTVTRTGGNSQTSTDYVFYTGYKTVNGEHVLDANGNLIPIFNSVNDVGFSGDTRIGWWISTRGAQLDVTTDTIFLNDRWDINEHWMVNMGLRHEMVESKATGGIQGVDTETTVPRLGVSFDPMGDGRYKFDVTYAEYAGRYNPAIIGDNTNVGNPALLYGSYYGPSGEGADFAPGFDPNNYNFWFASVPTQNTFIRDGLSSPVNEEFTVSGGMALGMGGHAKLTYVDRALSSVIDDFVTIDNGCTDILFEGGDFGCFDNVVLDNTDVPERNYEALMLQTRYNVLRNWVVEGNYTHQLTNEGTYEGEGGQAIGATPFGNRPEIQSPRNNPNGRLAQYQEHKLRLWSTYSFDMGAAGNLGVGLIYNYDSPLTFSYTTSLGLTAAQRANDPGYASLPTSQTVFFGERGAGEFASSSTFDLSLSYGLPILRRFEPWIKVDVLNVTNDDTLLTWNTGIVANTAAADPRDELGLPTTFREGSAFGNATGATSYQTPREFFVSAGIRF